jgi:hypothetical protein
MLKLRLATQLRICEGIANIVYNGHEEKYDWKEEKLGVATGYGLDNRMIGLRFSSGGWEVFSSTPRPG